MPKPKEVFSDFCDGSGFLPKTRVGDAVRCLGENPLQSEISDLTKQYSGQGITFEQFQEVVKTCKSQNQSPTDELSEAFSVFDVDGEGFVSMSHIRHLLSGESGAEALNRDQCDMLLDNIEVNEDGMVRIADLVTLIQQK